MFLGYKYSNIQGDCYVWMDNSLKPGVCTC